MGGPRTILSPLRITWWKFDRGDHHWLPPPDAVGQRARDEGWERFYGLVPRKWFPITNCGEWRCCNPLHLTLGTVDDYIQFTQGYRSDPGRRLNHHLATTTEAERREIRYIRFRATKQQIGRAFGIDRTTVYDILRFNYARPGVRKYRHNLSRNRQRFRDFTDSHTVVTKSNPLARGGKHQPR